MGSAIGAGAKRAQRHLSQPIPLTVALLGLHLLHLLQPLQHSPQVCDTVLEGDSLVVAGVRRLQDVPHIYLLLHLLLLLLPEEEEQKKRAQKEEVEEEKQEERDQEEADEEDE